MNSGGYIKLHRLLLESWFNDLKPAYFKVAVNLLLMANWKPAHRRFTGQYITIDRGEVASSLDGIVKKCPGVSKSQVRSAIKVLVTCEFIRIKPARGFTHLTIINYKDYQARDDDESHDSSTGLAPDSHRTRTASAPIEEGKKGRREEGKKKPMLDSSSGGHPSIIPLSRFEAAYSHYPRKQGKTKGLEKAVILIKTEEDFVRFGQCIMAMEKAWKGYELAKCPHFSTFVNQRRWNDEVWPLPNSDTPAKGPEYVNGQRKLPPPKAPPPQPERPGETREEWEARVAKERKVEI